MGQVNSNPNLQDKVQQEKKMNDLKSDLRAAHFHFGSDKPNYTSSAKGSLPQHEIDTTANNKAMDKSKELQKSNFFIGDDKKRDLKGAQTTYRQSISDAYRGNSSRQPVDMGLRVSHINIGNDNKTSYVTETKDKFPG